MLVGVPVDADGVVVDVAELVEVVADVGDVVLVVVIDDDDKPKTAGLVAANTAPAAITATPTSATAIGHLLRFLGAGAGGCADPGSIWPHGPVGG